MSDPKIGPELPLAGSENLGVSPDQKAQRPESGVFVSPQTSHDPDTVIGTDQATARVHHDSGYKSSVSESCPDRRASRNTTFYVGEQDPVDTILIDTDDSCDATGDGRRQFYVQDDDDDDTTDTEECTPSDLGTRLVPHPQSASMPIPDASSHHDAHASALRLMDATPPRTYVFGGAVPDAVSLLEGHHRYSTGCLSMQPVLIQALNERRRPETAEMLKRALRIGSGMLKSSTSRASLAQRRKSDALLTPLRLSQIQATEASESDPERPPMTRNRSMSAPDVRADQLIQRRCAEELRKISDEFYAEFPKTSKKRQPKTQSQSCDHHCLAEADEAVQDLGAASRRRGGPEEAGGRPTPTASSSFPGSRRQWHSSWWWQAIIQSMDPRKSRRRHGDFTPSASDSVLDTRDDTTTVIM